MQIKFITVEHETKHQTQNLHKSQIFSAQKAINPMVRWIKILDLSRGTRKHAHEQRSVICLQFKEHPRSKVKRKLYGTAPRYLDFCDDLVFT